MSDKTKIEWTDATWNVITGCSVTSPGCKHCYAMGLAGTRLRNHPSRAGLTQITSTGPVWTGEVRFNEGWLTQPLRWRKPRKIFVCAHADLFHESVPDEWIDAVFGVMWACLYGANEQPGHAFQVLTKRSARMRQYLSTDRRETWSRHAIHYGGGIDPDGLYDQIVSFEGPHPRIWLGVSVEDQRRADERIPDLLETPAAVRWVSAEPLLGPVDLNRIQHPKYQAILADALCGNGWPNIQWVVVGGESGAKARPMHPNWVRSIRDQCADAGVPFLFKQWGSWAPRAGALTGGGTDFAVLDPSCTRWPHVKRLGEHGLDTRIGENCTDDMGEEVYVQQVGKKSSGRYLDGVLHDGYPEPKQ